MGGVHILCWVHRRVSLLEMKANYLPDAKDFFKISYVGGFMFG